MHLWIGVGLGLYVTVVCLTGAALVFRIDLQRAEHPELLMPRQEGAALGAPEVLHALRQAYPGGRILGVDAPTTARPVYLSYVSDASRFRTVLVDPSSATVLGELPDRSAIRALQDLHFDLLAGDRGRLVNGFGALCILTLVLTGAAIWWQGKRRWTRGLSFRWRANRERRLWELHGAAGIWSLPLLGLWAVTALSFTFPASFRAAVNALSPLSTPVLPKSDPDSQLPGAGRPSWESVIAQASREKPDQHVARVVLPSTASDPIQVLFSREQPTPIGPQSLETLYFDQYSGARLDNPPPPNTGRGDATLKWAGPLHVGSFGGLPIKIVWVLCGLAPPVLFITGLITWWRRVVRPEYARRRAQGETYSGAL